MTENKRYSFNWKSGHPNFWDNHCDLADCYLTCGDVVDRLNELYDENQELKKKNKQLIIDFMDFKMKLIEQNRKNNDLLQSDIRILEKALWCKGCENDYGRLKELRKEFMR